LNEANIAIYIHYINRLNSIFSKLTSYKNGQFVNKCTKCTYEPGLTPGTLIIHSKHEFVKVVVHFFQH